LEKRDLEGGYCFGSGKVIEIKDAHGAASSEELVKIAAKFAEKLINKMTHKINL